MAGLIAVGAVLAGCAPSGDRRDVPDPSDVSGPRLVAAGDIACSRGETATAATCRQRQTARLATRLDPDVVAALGDLQYDVGAAHDFRGSFDRGWGALKPRIRPAVGNAEYGTPGAGGYFGYFGSRAGARGRGWYSYDLGGWHVVVLNSSCHEVGGCEDGSPQGRWLAGDLRRHRTRCMLAYWHHPYFSSGAHGPDPSVGPLWRAFQRAGGDVVLSGHDHSYERFAPLTWRGAVAPERGVVQFVVGTGGRSSYPIERRDPRSRAQVTGTFGLLDMVLGQHAYSWRFLPAGASSPAARDVGAARC